MERVLFHAMDGKVRVVVFLMDQEGDRTVYRPGSKATGDAWPHYSTFKPYLEAWFGQHVGQVVRTPAIGCCPSTSHDPGTSEYPRGLAVALTHDAVLPLWAYVTARDILVSRSQVARALGVPRRGLARHLEEAQIVLQENGGSNRTIGIHEVKRAFGQDVADRLVLRSGQIADFLGVRTRSVPDIVKRLEIGSGSKGPQVTVSWGTLRRVKRVGSISFEVSSA